MPPHAPHEPHNATLCHMVPTGSDKGVARCHLLQYEHLHLSLSDPIAATTHHSKARSLWNGELSFCFSQPLHIVHWCAAMPNILISIVA